MRTIKTRAYFEDIGFHLKRELRNARESVKICVAWINWSDYVPIFNELTRRGVSVEVMYYDDFLNAKNFVHPSPQTVLYPIKMRLKKTYMHNKFCIIDNSTLITGSFNWSKQARNHFENVVIIDNDFHLIKQYLNEYADLENYFSNYAQNSKLRCFYEDESTGKQCLSSSYNLGIWGQENGKYDESLLEVWNVCFSHEDHGTFLHEQYEQFLDTRLGLKDAPDWDDEHSYDKEAMLGELNQEREQTQSLHDYFHSLGEPIHAIGVVVMTNQHEHLEYKEDPEFVIKIIWKDMYYRKRIPDEIYDDGYGFTGDIIARHTGYSF